MQRFSNNSAMPGLVQGNQTVANSLLYFLAGSLNNAQSITTSTIRKILSGTASSITPESSHVPIRTIGRCSSRMTGRSVRVSP